MAQFSNYILVCGGTGCRASQSELILENLKEAVKILFQDNVELYTVSITYSTAVTSPKLHGDYGAVQQYVATWNELWKEAE